MIENRDVRVPCDALTDFVYRVFCALDVPEADARVAAEATVAADLRGVFSHGVAHLRRYLKGMQDGIILPRPEVRVIVETPVSATIDGGSGLGHPVAFHAMQRAIQKARDYGAGFVAVRKSNHYGIAAYYAMLALEHDCIGMAMTNGSAVVLPTFGRTPMLGTNPIAVAVPAGRERPYVLDMATSTVALGKVEIAERLEQLIPAGWATDETGHITQDPRVVVRNYRDRGGGGLLPLGGEGELYGGHKGYGLALWVDVFSALLSGAASANLTYPRRADGKSLFPGIGHFFGAWRLDAFRPPAEFKAAMDDTLQRLRTSPKASGQSRIYIHGEKAFEADERHRREGVPVNGRVYTDLAAIARELGVRFGL